MRVSTDTLKSSRKTMCLSWAEYLLIIALMGSTKTELSWFGHGHIIEEGSQLCCQYSFS